LHNPAGLLETVNQHMAAIVSQRTANSSRTLAGSGTLYYIPPRLRRII